MTNYSTGNEIVDQIGQINLIGHITPHVWYETILLPTGKADFHGIAILSEIVYWYRPSEIKDKISGQFLGFKAKFDDDFLQRSYDDLADHFGISKRQATEAVVRLEKAGVVKRHLRNLRVNGMNLNNVTFIELIPAGLYAITFPGDLSRKSGGGGCPENSGEGVPKIRETNTKSSLKILRPNNNNHNSAGEHDPKSQPLKTEEPKPKNPKQPKPKEDAFSVYEQITNLPLTSRLSENIQDAINFYGEDLTIACFKHAGDSATRAIAWAFVQSIFDEWRSNGVETIEQARAYVKGQRQRKQQQAQQPRKQYGQRSGRVELLPSWFTEEKEQKQRTPEEEKALEKETADLEQRIKTRKERRGKQTDIAAEETAAAVDHDFEAKKAKLKAELAARKTNAANRQTGNS